MTDCAATLARWFAALPRWISFDPPHMESVYRSCVSLMDFHGHGGLRTDGSRQHTEGRTDEGQTKRCLNMLLNCKSHARPEGLLFSFVGWTTRLIGSAGPAPADLRRLNSLRLGSCRAPNKHIVSILPAPTARFHSFLVQVRAPRSHSATPHVSSCFYERVDPFENDLQNEPR